jgi:hypothetical protein
MRALLIATGMSKPSRAAPLIKPSGEDPIFGTRSAAGVGKHIPNKKSKAPKHFALFV